MSTLSRAPGASPSRVGIITGLLVLAGARGISRRLSRTAARSSSWAGTVGAAALLGSLLVLVILAFAAVVFGEDRDEAFQDDAFAPRPPGRSDAADTDIRSGLAPFIDRHRCAPRARPERGP
jgi:hypothetical protein